MIVDGFLDWCERVDGPAHKKFPNPNQGIGIAMHSVVGNLPGHAIPSRFFDPVDQASVMFILYRDGHVIQMYDCLSSTWTSGSHAANTMYWAIEAEGGGHPDTREKLTPEAEESFIRIVSEWEGYTGRKALPENLLQHKELVAKYGGGATACASDRYSNAVARVFAGERYGSSVTREEYEDLLISVYSGSEEKDLPRDQRLANALYRSGEIVKGNAASVNDRASSAIANHKAHIDGHTTGSGDAEHSHSQYVLKDELRQAT